MRMPIQFDSDLQLRMGNVDLDACWHTFVAWPTSRNGELRFPARAKTVQHPHLRYGQLAVPPAVARGMADLFQRPADLLPDTWIPHAVLHLLGARDGAEPLPFPVDLPLIADDVALLACSEPRGELFPAAMAYLPGQVDSCGPPWCRPLRAGQGWLSPLLGSAFFAAIHLKIPFRFGDTCFGIFVDDTNCFLCIYHSSQHPRSAKFMLHLIRRESHPIY